MFEHEATQLSIRANSFFLKSDSQLQKVESDKGSDLGKLKIRKFGNLGRCATQNQNQ